MAFIYIACSINSGGTIANIGHGDKKNAFPAMIKSNRVDQWSQQY